MSQKRLTCLLGAGVRSKKRVDRAKEEIGGGGLGERTGGGKKLGGGQIKKNTESFSVEGGK